MTGAILIVSHTHDPHALDVLERLRAGGAEVQLFDTGRIPRETRLTIGHDAAGWNAVACGGGEDLDLKAVRAVWWRRPQPFAVDAMVVGVEDRSFALAETAAAVAGLWALLDARWINDPERDERATRKAWQLSVARECGLAIPRTLITNDPDRAREFVDSEGPQIIYKAFQGTEEVWRETRILRASEHELLNTVRHAPVIFQQYIPATADLRVTIVGQRIFAAAIDSSRSSYPVDFRMDMQDARITEAKLPSDLCAALLRLMGRLGLVYGAVDLRLTPDGDYVFLEINPAGQWLFIELATGTPISATIADELTRMANSEPSRKRSRI
nr:hypothetical protein [uncultured Novosphingobium sp.]